MRKIQEYSIKTDKVFGRIFFTKLEDAIVSSINNSMRGLDNPMAGLRNDLFPPMKYETAVIISGKTIVTAHTQNLKTLEKNHRKTVEKIISGYEFTDKDIKMPPLVFSSKGMKRYAKQKNWE